jgi:hypothetical protein
MARPSSNGDNHKNAKIAMDGSFEIFSRTTEPAKNSNLQERFLT